MSAIPDRWTAPGYRFSSSYSYFSAFCSTSPCEFSIRTKSQSLQTFIVEYARIRRPGEHQDEPWSDLFISRPSKTITDFWESVRKILTMIPTRRGTQVQGSDLRWPKVVRWLCGVVWIPEYHAATTDHLDRQKAGDRHLHNLANPYFPIPHASPSPHMAIATQTSFARRSKATHEDMQAVCLTVQSSVLVCSRVWSAGVLHTLNAPGGL